MNLEPTIFSQIINREIPADIVYEDNDIIVIKNIRPLAPIHLLGITKQPFFQLHELLQSDKNKDLLWHIFSTLAKIASDLGVAEDGYRLSTNIGTDAGQQVPHLHIHLLAGKKLQEPSK